MIDIFFRSIGKVSTKKSLLRLAAVSTIQAVSPDRNLDCTILVCNDNYIRILNKRYRGIDAPTDVLSFSSEPDEINAIVKYIGDVVISYETALRQASDAGHPLDHELCLLVIHGVLHLLGYDHQDLAQKQMMWSVQKQVLDSLGMDLKHYSGDVNDY